MPQLATKRDLRINGYSGFAARRGYDFGTPGTRTCLGYFTSRLRSSRRTSIAHVQPSPFSVSFSFWGIAIGQEILVMQHDVQLIEIRCEGNRRGKTLEKPVAAAAFRDFL